MGFTDCLIIGSTLTAGFFCALNAALDFRRFKLFGKIVCFCWFGFMSFITPFILWDIATTKSFSSL